MDWDLRTSLPGLFAAGGAPVFGSGCHGESHTTGRCTGRKAAAYAKIAKDPALDRGQVEAQKRRAYVPVKSGKDGVGWKELTSQSRASCRITAASTRTSHPRPGLDLVGELRENEGASHTLRTPTSSAACWNASPLLRSARWSCRPPVRGSAAASTSISTGSTIRRWTLPSGKSSFHRLEEGHLKVRDLALDFHLSAQRADVRRKLRATRRKHQGGRP